MALNPIQQGQLDAIFASQGEAKTPEIPVTLTPTTAVPFQVSTQFMTVVYIAVNTSAALQIQLGNSSTASNDVTLSNNSASVGLISLIVPAGFWLTLTGTMADITVKAVVQDTQAVT